MRKIIGLALTTGLLVASAGAGHAGPPKKVWSDGTGDLAVGGTGETPPGFDQSGFDLVSGSIQRKGAKLVFSVKQAGMTPAGALPEAVRFMWAFSVGTTSYRVTVKRAEIGKPNPLNQEDTDQIGKAYPDGFFRLEGNCGSETVGALQAVTCHTIGYLKGAWAPATATFTFEVPMKSIKAKTGSRIGGGAGDAIGICSICWVTHAAERSLDATIIDETAQSAIYKVPRS